MQKRHLNRELYFDELVRTTRKYILPYIENFHSLSPGSRVLEVGCGEGGNLKPFVEKGCEVMGVDSTEMKIVHATRFLGKEGNERVSLVFSDILEVEPPACGFDLIIINDVLEHVENKKRFLNHVRRFLSAGGMIFLGFPAWQMPFAGHQQICKGKVVSRLPFIHLLPSPVYASLLKCFRESPGMVTEMLYVKKCRITVEGFRSMMKEMDFDIVDERFFLINPHYEAKFGLRPRHLYGWVGKIPYFRNYFTTACYYLIR